MGDQHESYSEMLEQSLNLRWPNSPLTKSSLDEVGMV